MVVIKNGIVVDVSSPLATALYLKERSKDRLRLWSETADYVVKALNSGGIETTERHLQLIEKANKFVFFYQLDEIKKKLLSHKNGLNILSDDEMLSIYESLKDYSINESDLIDIQVDLRHSFQVVYEQITHNKLNISLKEAS